MHYLRWDAPYTLYGCERAGFNYEISMGCAARTRFRCGACHEYTAFDPVSKTESKLRMHSLMVMEFGVILEN